MPSFGQRLRDVSLRLAEKFGGVVVLIKDDGEHAITAGPVTDATESYAAAATNVQKPASMFVPAKGNSEPELGDQIRAGGRLFAINARQTFEANGVVSGWQLSLGDIGEAD